MLKQYINSIFVNLTEVPDIVKDIDDFVNSTDWYEILGDFCIAYPILIEESKGIYIWEIIFESEIDTCKIKIINEEIKEIPIEIKQFMKNFPIYLSHELGYNNSCSGFQEVIIKKITKRFWNTILKINYPNHFSS